MLIASPATAAQAQYVGHRDEAGTVGEPTTCAGATGAYLDLCQRAAAEQRREDDDRAQAHAITAAQEAKARQQAEYMASQRAHNAEGDRQAAAENARADLLPETHAAKIRDFRHRIAGFRAMIARERRIGATSGYVNRDMLYRYGEAIEMANERIAEEYRRYRELGGRKALGAI